MKYIPILFSTPMVQAILEDRKTMTRRIADVPVGDHMGKDIMDWGLSKHPFQEDGQWFYKVQTAVDDFRTHHLPCKYQKGDVLWVRETSVYACTSEDGEGPIPGTEYRYYYRADKDWQHLEWDHPEKDGPQDSPIWKPSIFMPKTACRIFLEVTDVRVERLQNISWEDAVAEGCPGYRPTQDEPTQQFERLWDSINGKKYPWKLNNWVIVVSFKRIEKPEMFN